MYVSALPWSLTSGKDIVEVVSISHQFVMYDLVIDVELAKPARPKTAGGAMGCKKICTDGVCARVFSTLSSFP
jgi:hypothetical protein